MSRNSRITKMLSLLLALICTIGCTLTADAATVPGGDAAFKGVDKVQTVTVSEMDMIDNHVRKGGDVTVYRDRLLELQGMTTDDLHLMGMSDEEVKAVKNYDGISNPVEYIRVNQLASATITAEFGLAGSDISRKSTRIVCQTVWSEMPFFTFKDQVGITWLMADKNSKPLLAKIDSAESTVSYFKVSNDAFTRSVNVTGDKDYRYYVTKYKISSDAPISEYAKKTLSIVEISTQSGSSNMETIQVGIYYGHSTIVLEPSFSISPGTEAPFGVSISFSKGVDQLIKKFHTFNWNDYTSVIPAP